MSAPIPHPCCRRFASGVWCERMGETAVVTLASPPLNILTTALLADLTWTIDCAGRHGDFRALVLRAEGKVFSGGADVAEHLPGKVAPMLAAFRDVFRALWDLALPTIAVVQGPALGGGCELAAFFDVVIASDRARFGQPEIKLAALAPVAMAIFPALVGPREAARLLLTGATIDAEEARRIGLATAVVPHDVLDGELAARLDELGGLSRPVLGFAARALRRTTWPDLPERLAAAERSYLEEVAPLPDAEEGLRAFIEKRSPRWRREGRPA